MWNRDKNLLTDDTNQKCQYLMTKVKEVYGYNIFITDGFRTWAEQDELYAQWRTQSWKIVTWTRDSRHEYGIAFDIAFNPNGEGELYPTNHQLWENVAKIARSIGLNRGFDMRWVDKPHFENNGVPICRYVTPKADLDVSEREELDKILRVLWYLWENYDHGRIREWSHTLANHIRDIL